MKTKIIVNPISGRGKQKNIEELLYKYLDMRKFEFDISFTQKHLHAKEIAKQAVKDSYKIVIVVGGDGTVNEVASELIDTNLTLAILPAGSGNGLALHLGMNRKLEKSIQQLNNGKIHLIDSATANSMPFFNVSGIGFDAHIANLFSNLKSRGFSNYIKLIAKEIFYKAKQYTICYEGNEKELEAVLISFANASQYGNNFRIAPKANIKDGKLDFVIVKDIPRWKIPLFLFNIARGKIEQSEYVSIVQSEEMKIKSSDSIIHLDGEPKNIEGTLEIKVKQNSLNILIPNGKE